ncbi:ATP synthase F1 subunit epsilon [Sulfuriroseicoccus oceanibius]|uniref:ATP synthase epsilon chain n=1 Tax=Sulfuriroseicoccus oceanibius TaxID=2707525 RepID=A0A6B3L817_9BACT|nr:ATP synthase F1 subunit epsilon [Sulfuriroseicoccus oceanibius]QQL43884.1 ATP synthase F1 subunit epsilon [Sulfuriroseicoccus oceanibius]
MSMLLKIVTPESTFFSGEVEGAVVPGIVGQLGLLPNHAPMVTTMEPGELTYTQNGESKTIAVGEGFIEVTQDHVSILTDLAVTHADIDLAAEEDAIARAKRALENADHTPEEVAAVRASLAKSLVKVGLKRRQNRSI